MLTYLQAIILGALQGATELFPVSSLGHSVILPSLFRWHIDQGTDFFLAFLVSTHLATALVLFFYFFNDWKKIIIGIFHSLKVRVIDENDMYAKIGWLIIIGTVPVGILGILFERQFENFFASPRAAAIFLILNGILLWSMELYKRQKSIEKIELNLIEIDSHISRISWASSIKVGIAQCVALIPGFSRTGATLGGGLIVGLDHASAARFSFLLATPVIAAAAVLKLPELAISGDSSVIGPIIIGSLISALFAYLSVKFLTKYFKTHTLKPFAIYCIAFGVLSSFLLM